MTITIAPLDIGDLRAAFGVTERALVLTTAVTYELPLTEESRMTIVQHRAKKRQVAEAAVAKKRESGEEPTDESFSFKAVDTTTGELVGVAHWRIHYRDEPVTTTIEQDALAYVVPALPQVRTKALIAFRCCLERIGRMSVALPSLKEGEDPNSAKMLRKRVYLDILAVDPRYQGQGIGKALLQWGLDEADRLGMITFLEATNEGKPLYEKFGFEPTISETLELAPFGLRGGLTHTVRVFPCLLLCAYSITDKLTGHG